MGKRAGNDDFSKEPPITDYKNLLKMKQGGDSHHLLLLLTVVDLLFENQLEKSFVFQAWTVGFLLSLSVKMMKYKET